MFMEGFCQEFITVNHEVMKPNTENGITATSAMWDLWSLRLYLKCVLIHSQKFYFNKDGYSKQIRGHIKFNCVQSVVNKA